MIETSWDQEFSARFRKISADDRDLWELVIKEELPSCKTVDIKEALKTVVERKRKGEIEYIPTVEDLIKAVKFNWWQKKQAREGDISNERCSLCVGGRMSYYEDSKTKEIGKRENGYYEYGIPCLCSKGEKVLQKHYKPENYDEIKNRAHKVKDWIISISESAETLDMFFAIKEASG